ncbi:MAG: M16 family metallopeptidase [Bacteroidia bacterium]
MKTKTILFIALFLFSAVAKSGLPEGKRILPYPIHQKKLPNGLNVVTVPFDSPGLAAFYIVMRVGSREEVEKGKTGFAHFFEHMMFRGTEKYPKEKYSDILKSIGASANANTSLDRTVYHMTGNAAMLDKMFELEADRFMNLKYSIQDFKTEAGAVKGEYTKNYSNPRMKLYEATLDTAFDKHTYSHTTMGFFEDVVDMPNQYDYSIEFFNRFYRPEYATIIVVGDVKPESVNALAEKYFGVWKQGNYKAQIPAEPAQAKTKNVHMQVAKFPPQLELGFKIPGYSDANIELPALSLLSDVLFSERSDLYKKLVAKEQKLRSIGGSFFMTRDQYMFGISCTLVKEEDLQYVKDEIFSAIEKIKLAPVDEKILSETKSRTRYGFAMGMDSPDAIANSLAYFTWVTGDPETINRYYALMDRVTPQHLTDVAKKYFTNNSLTISTISSQALSSIK